MNWISTNDYIDGTFKSDQFTYNNKIACFDLDGTIITVKSGSKFPKDEKDWIFFSDNVIKKMYTLHKNNYSLIIISNQAGIAKGKQSESSWKIKLEHICAKINLPFKIFASKDNNIYRKPYTTFWNIIKNNANNSIHPDSFYCGDACGRKNDHSDTDYKFALNCGIKFITPESLFNNMKNHICNATYNTDFDILKNIKKPDYNFIFKKKELIFLIGYPGSGKSTIAEKYLVPLGYYRINRDTLKTKEKCLNECINQIENGNSIVIDNINFDSITRKSYIDVAVKKKYNIKCIIINCDHFTAYHTAHYRSFKSNGNIKSIPMLVYNKYKKEYEPPNLKKEKINEIIELNFYPPNDEDYYKYYY